MKRQVLPLCVLPTHMRYNDATRMYNPLDFVIKYVNFICRILFVRLEVEFEDMETIFVDWWFFFDGNIIQRLILIYILDVLSLRRL